jgi:hypothetical protein
MHQRTPRRDNHQARVQIRRDAEQVVLAAADPVQKNEKRRPATIGGRDLRPAHQMTKR